MSEMDRLLSERHLFHGTSADVVEGICKHNFDPRVCGKHATMFGQGSYFARKAVYSHNFSKRSPKGVHCMFLAKVLTGRCVCGRCHQQDDSGNIFCVYLIIDGIFHVSFYLQLYYSALLGVSDMGKMLYHRIYYFISQ